MDKLEEEKLNESAVSTPPSTVAEAAAPDTIEKLDESPNRSDLEKSDATPPVRNIHGWKVSLVMMM